MAAAFPKVDPYPSFNRGEIGSFLPGSLKRFQLQFQASFMIANLAMKLSALFKLMIGSARSR